MATFNRAELLPHTIAAVRAQSWTDWELIVIGDACTDATAGLLEHLMREDARIRFVNRATRYGEQSGPNNDGFDLGRGRYVAFLNHDDIWLPSHLATAVAEIERSGADLVFCLPLAADIHGVVWLYPVASDLRYDPALYIPASFWLLRAELRARVGPWFPARAIWGFNPSQNFLFRCWRHRARIQGYAAATCIALPSGGRANGYALRDPTETAHWAARVRDEPDLSQHLLTDAVRAGRHGDTRLPRALWPMLRDRGTRVWWGWIARLGIEPQAVRGFLRFRRKGAWMEHLHRFRGLPPREAEATPPPPPRPRS